jgi:hypothetical protein
MKPHVCAAALVAIGICAAGAAQAATDPAACLQPNRFYSWKDLDNRAVIITDKLRHDYKLSLEPGCFDLNFSLSLGIKSFSTSPLSCVAIGDYVIVPRQAGTPRQRCRIEKVEAYTPAMAHADAVAKAAKAPH